MRMPRLEPMLDDIESGILEPSHNPLSDHNKVKEWVALKGRPSRPQTPTPGPRSEEEFNSVRALLPSDFFEPFDNLLKLVGVLPIEVEPRYETIQLWNNPDYSHKVVGEILRAVDSTSTRRSALIFPYLVEAFMNLERERLPDPNAWPDVDAIVVPGSRTLDRAAEAYRAYRLSRGHSFIITSGKAPYYDLTAAGTNLTESDSNASYLRLLGVPGSRIVVEDDSHDTQANAEFVVEAIIELSRIEERTLQNIVLVTSPFHLARFRLQVEVAIQNSAADADIYAIGSRASKYWAETYFLEDEKSGYSRKETLQVVLNEYFKIAYDLCTNPVPETEREGLVRDDGIR